MNQNFLQAHRQIVGREYDPKVLPDPETRFKVIKLFVELERKKQKNVRQK